ncbi:MULTISPECIES: beta-ketoacyl-ACP synthase III [Vogesella]|jgi:3-oxoacyl-[acyl-carrier-protein] synthase-3|uniref:Beta-ketoacyl-[acyl-carrier-protein] synthase III n=1 Tax=Vogesella indigofera TaxID=45465 RepID=A0ABT5I5J3_VOGIN|nr:MULTISPECIES: beta-ketoacyl-ACP synthase III [Vogesella]KMJ54481.1 3-oxoacyl-ACP synthase [Vogesella sp. EB]MCQ4145793.1 ketoacyl-ACP synthase III [Vogesella sp. AC12]MDC7690761.1 ketoacyl-ACP synthase III [Vogesella indigofera]MDC7696398.1 ketoacyl-ACP synthase III [Vogesella indigofera]MDC7710807.1 ketoacyl-ACP synthase III [Vogesella indigofera]
MTYSRILGTGSYLPELLMTNAMLAERVETSDEWIVSRTGIRARHIAADDQKTSDLAYLASLKAIESAGIEASELDLIIVATTTPDMVFPSTACILQEKLGVPGIPAFDVQAVCAGFMYALVTANNYIKAGMAKKVLVVGAELMSRILDWDDRRTCVLFGDGAGAMVLEASDEPGLLHAKLAADGRYQGILNTPAQIAGGKIQGMPYLHMDGPAVFKFAVKALSDIAEKTLDEAGVAQADVDWLVPHQANLRIIESTAKHLKLSMDKVIVTLPEQGNTSAASIPLAFDCAVRDGRIQRGQTVLLEGIGGGFAWGAVLLRF